MSRLQYELVCACGAYWPTDEDRHLMFGFDFICQACGRNVGSDGGEFNIRRRVVRYAADPAKRWWKPWTWLLPSRRTVVGVEWDVLDPGRPSNRTEGQRIRPNEVSPWSNLGGEDQKI